jgi:hypothetical protein
MKNMHVLAAVSLLALASCTSIGPTVAVMPGAHKTLAQFQQDTTNCTQFADQNLSAAADQYNKNQIGVAVASTALGAGLGAAIGGGYGAGVGAASGAIVGTGTAAVMGNRDLYTLQRRYDIAYSQCMMIAGDRVPLIQ